jgi:hypothetical protein
MVVVKNAFIDSSEGPPKGRQWDPNWGSGRRGCEGGVG